MLIVAVVAAAVLVVGNRGKSPWAQVTFDNSCDEVVFVGGGGRVLLGWWLIVAVLELAWKREKGTKRNGTRGFFFPGVSSLSRLLMLVVDFRL